MLGPVGTRFWNRILTPFLLPAESKLIADLTQECYLPASRPVLASSCSAVCLKRVSEAANARNPCSRGRAAAVAEQAGATVGKSCSAQLVSAAPTRAR